MFGSKLILAIISAFLIQFLLCNGLYDLDKLAFNLDVISNLSFDISPETYLLTAVVVIALFMFGLVRYVHRLDSECKEADEHLVGLFCPECGRQLTECEDFCYFCGNELTVKRTVRMTYIDRIAKYEPEYAGKH